MLCIIFQHYHVWVRKLVSICFFEKDDAKLPRKRKALIRYEEIQGSAEFVSKVEQY